MRVLDSTKLHEKFQSSVVNPKVTSLTIVEVITSTYGCCGWRIPTTEALVQALQDLYLQENGTTSDDGRYNARRQTGMLEMTVTRVSIN